MPIRVAFADDSLLIRQGVATVLAAEPELELVSTSHDGPSLLAAIVEHRPDVVMTDIRMPPGHSDEGLQIARTLRAAGSDVGVVLLSQWADPEYALALLNGGSDGRAYLLKDRLHDGGQLLAAIRTVAEGGSVIDAAIVDLLVEVRAAAERSPLRHLTPREREVLAELAQGKSNAAIAESLVLSKRAVEKHINSIFWRLDLEFAQDVSKRVKAALLYLDDRPASEAA